MAFDKVGLIEILQNAKILNHLRIAYWPGGWNLQRQFVPSSLKTILVFSHKGWIALEKAKVDHPGESLRMERLYRKRNAWDRPKIPHPVCYGQRIFWNTNASKNNDG